VKKRSIILAGLAMAILAAFACLPALAAWTYTSSNPALFEFDDATDDHTNFNHLGAPYGCPGTPAVCPKTFNLTSYGPPKTWGLANFYSEESRVNTKWHWIFDPTGTGTFTMRTYGGATPDPGGATDGNASLFRNFCGTGQPWDLTGLDMMKGFVVEVKAKTVGDEDPASWPDGYNWGPSNRAGGICMEMHDSANQWDASVCFNWVTGDPSVTTDDKICLTNTGYPSDVASTVVYNSLGGTPTTPPEHIYKLLQRINPLQSHFADPVKYPKVDGNNELISIWVSDADGSNTQQLLNEAPVRLTYRSSSSGGYGNSNTFWLGTTYDNNNTTTNAGNYAGMWQRGDVYDWVKMYENDVACTDVTPPSTPGNLTATATPYWISLKWDASTDDGQVLGYFVYANGCYDRAVTATNVQYTYLGASAATGTFIQPGMTVPFAVKAVDACGNISAQATVTATTPAEIPTNVLTFDFDDNGNAEYLPASDPNYFSTVPNEAGASRDFWIGKKGIGDTADGSVYWDAAGTTCTMRMKFSDAGDGSLTVQTVSPGVDPTPGPTGRAMVDSDDLGNWFKWIRDPAGTYYRGVSMEVDMDIVGDKNGWCAPWGSFPVVGACPWTSDLGHQASDWGSQWSDRSVFLNIGSGLHLGATGYEPEGCYVDFLGSAGPPAEWLQWDNRSVVGGTYKPQLRYSSRVGKTLAVQLDIDTVKAGTFDFVITPNSGNDFQTVSMKPESIVLGGGPHTIRLTCLRGCDAYLNWLQLTDPGGTNSVRLQTESPDQASADNTVGNFHADSCAADTPCANPTFPDMDIGYSIRGPAYTENGAQLSVMVCPGNDIRSASDDRVKIRNMPNADWLTLYFKDGLGLGLTPEDGTNACGDRDGVIDGTCSHVKVKMAVTNAGGGTALLPNSYEYWDVWITRPNGKMIHLNPGSCIVETGTQAAAFGLDFHTLKIDYTSNGFSGNRIELGMREAGNIFGEKYNKVTLRNDWDGNVIVYTEKLGELHTGWIGAMVKFDCVTGGNKVVSNETTMSVDGNAPFFYYVEQEDRSAGVRIIVADDADAPTRGDKVSVKGLLIKDADGNLCVDTRVLGGYCTLTSGGPIVAPLSMTNKTAGGKEVTGGAGADNTCLLATVWGKVSNVVYDGGTGVLTFDLDDGSATPVSVADYAGDGQILYGDRPVAGKYWKATGILALKLDGSDYKRLLIIDGDGTTVGFKTEKIP